MKVLIVLLLFCAFVQQSLTFTRDKAIKVEVFVKQLVINITRHHESDNIAKIRKELETNHGKQWDDGLAQKAGSINCDDADASNYRSLKFEFGPELDIELLTKAKSVEEVTTLFGMKMVGCAPKSCNVTFTCETLVEALGRGSCDSDNSDQSGSFSFMCLLSMNPYTEVSAPAATQVPSVTAASKFGSSTDVTSSSSLSTYSIIIVFCIAFRALYS